MPVSLKIFLTAPAILDDLGAVLIIALFHTADLSLQWLGLAGVVLVVLAGFNRAEVTSLAIYPLLGAVVWRAGPMENPGPRSTEFAFLPALASR